MLLTTSVGKAEEEELIATARAVAAATAQLVAASRAKAGDDQVYIHKFALLSINVPIIHSELTLPTVLSSQSSGRSNISTGGCCQSCYCIPRTRFVDSFCRKVHTYNSFRTEAAEVQEDYNFTGSKVKELEQQMKILKLEKELETARKQMLNSRKQANYGN